MRRTVFAPLSLSLALLVSLAPSPAHGTPAGQTPPDNAPRPRVCLALSGGGAVGLAHVGVLRALEKLRVPIDCVSGTSMGAVVGGLYAAGYSPQELEHIVQTLDWSELLRDTPDRRRLPFRRKVDDLTYLSRWELGLSRSGIKTPTGIVAGHRIGATLHLLTLRAGGIEDFDQLARPFRAVAADARTGETVVLGRGDLGMALRASMAIPGLFTPVHLDGRVLVDGGIVDNLPVGVARSLGASVVIAVDLDQPLATREVPDSIGSILSGSLGVLSRREVERSLAQADFVIRPGILEYGLLDFQAAEPLIERGAQAVEGQAEALARLALDEEAWARHIAARRRTAPDVAAGPEGARAEAWEFLFNRGGILDHWGYLSNNGISSSTVQAIRQQLSALKTFMGGAPLARLKSSTNPPGWIINGTLNSYPTGTLGWDGARSYDFDVLLKIVQRP